MISHGLVIFGRVRAGPWLLIWSEIFWFFYSVCFSSFLDSWRVWLISTITDSRSIWLIPRLLTVQSILVLREIASFFRALKVSNWTSKYGIVGLESFEVFHLSTCLVIFSLMLWLSFSLICCSVALKALICLIVSSRDSHMALIWGQLSGRGTDW